MTGPEHYREAVRLAERAETWADAGRLESQHDR